MKAPQSIDDVYAALDALIGELRSAGQSKLADVLDHRIHEVTWTTATELFEELKTVLGDALSSKKLPGELEQWVALIHKTVATRIEEANRWFTSRRGADRA